MVYDKVARETMRFSCLLGVVFLATQQQVASLASPWFATKSSSLVHDSVSLHLVQKTYDAHRRRFARQALSQQSDDVIAMPDNLHFRFRLGERQVDLQLERSRKGVAELPLYVIEGGRIRRKELVPDNTIELYSNQSTGSSFVVRKSGNQDQFILEGIFFDGLDQLHLTPDPIGGLYRVHKQHREVDLRDDYINTVNTGGSSYQTTQLPSADRHRRQIEEIHRDHEIRIAMVSDYQDYLTWWKYYQCNSTRTVMEMNLYYSFIANSINLRYGSVNEVDPSFKLEIVVTGLLIVKTPLDSLFTENNTLRQGSHYIDANKSLEDFKLWVEKWHADIPASDHWMLFTGFDVYTQKNPFVSGLAFLNSMCTMSSVSIIEQDYTASVGANAAHELGHSLGALHDSDEKDCKDEEYYVMSWKLKTPDNETKASRPWQFSKCSVRAFKKFLSGVNCTNKSSRGQSMLTSGLSPGQVYSADKQCHLALGNGSNFARLLQYIEGYSSMCRRMFCTVPNSPGLFQGIFPMERTSCGDRKWCQRGRCEIHLDAPSVEDQCPQGDYPNALCVAEHCPLYIPRSRIGMCCHTCSPQKQGRAPYTPNNIFGMSVEKKIATPPSDTTTSTSTQTVIETTTQEIRDWPQMTTEAYSDQYTTVESVTTAPPTTPLNSESLNATFDTFRNPGPENTNHSSSKTDPTRQEVFYSTTNSTVDLLSQPGTSQHPSFSSDATEAYPTSTPSLVSPPSAPGVSAHTAESLPLQRENSTGDHVTGNRSSHWQTELSPVLLKYLFGQGVENSTGGNGILATTVTENVTGSLDIHFQESRTKTNTSEQNAETVSQQIPQTYPLTNVALHLSVDTKSPPTGPRNVSVVHNSVSRLSPDQELNMIHGDSGLSSLTPPGEEAVKLNVVSSVKDPVVNPAGPSLANASTAVNDADSVDLKGPVDHLAFDRTPGKVSQIESNHISQSPSGYFVKEPQNMITSLWLLVTTPEPNPNVAQKMHNLLEASKPEPSSVASFRLSQAEASPDKSVATSVSSKERAIFSKEISNSRPPVSSDNAGIGSSVSAPKSKILRENVMGSLQTENTPENVYVLNSRVFPAVASGGEYTDSALNADVSPLFPLLENPGLNIPERLSNNPMSNGYNLNYRSRWWEDVLSHWPTGDPTQSDVPGENRAQTSSQQAPDPYVPRGHKVEIISFQPQFQQFLEELSSLDATSTLSRQPLTTPGPERQRVIPNCRFQCVFYRELVNPQEDTSTQVISLLTKSQPSAANGMTPLRSQTAPSSTRLDIASNAGLLASLKSPKTRN